MSIDDATPTVSRDGGLLRLPLTEALPRPLPAGVERVLLDHPMLADHPAPGLFEEVAARRREMADSEATLLLELRLDTQNWIHLPGWARPAAEHGIPVVLHLAEADEPHSLAGLEGEAIAAIRQVLRHWSEKDWGASLADGEAPGQIRAWQEAAAVTQSSERPLALPGLDHPLWADEELAEEFLRDLLRLHDSPRVAGWLESLVGHPDYAARARESRSLRFAGYWLVAAIQQRAAMPLVGEVFTDREDAARFHAQDLAATRGTPWEGWYDSWARELGLATLAGERPAFLPTEPPPPPSPATAEPRVTVLVPSYRHEAFIERTLRSVLTQTDRALRVVVVDDASDDATVEVARALDDPRLSVRVNERNLGLGHTLARALAEVQTPYVAVLNSDDLFHPRRLEHCLEVLEADAEAQLVATDLCPVDVDDHILRRADASPLFEGVKICEWLDWFEGMPFEGEADPDSPDPLPGLLRSNHLLTSSNLVGRREFFVAEQRRWIEQEFCLDWQLLLAAAQQGGLRHLRQPLLGYRLHPSNTVWFDPERKWRYFVESHQVVARVLRRELEGLAHRDDADPRRLLEWLSGPLQQNTGLDGLGLLAALFLDQTGRTARELDATTRELARTLCDQADARDRDRQLAERIGDQRETLLHALGELGFLRAFRSRGEILEELLGDARGRIEGLESDRENLEGLWHRAEAERDREVEARREERERRSQELERAKELEERAKELEERAKELELQFAETQRDLDQRTAERDAALRSAEYRVGDLLLNRLKLRPLLRAVETGAALVRHRARGLRLGAEKLWTGHPRVMATACWNFPIWSQTFVYQELTQLVKEGYQVRFSYSHLEPRDHLPPAFQVLWPRRRALMLHRKVNVRDFAWYRRRMPEKVRRLIDLICEHSGQTEEYLVHHDNFLQAFSYARQAEAYGADYLHSYFFYDRSFMSLVAGFLLDLPRGVSCYADHLMDDYEFKMVPLHLELCDVVIATSARIKDELYALRPSIDPDKILVKPNAVDGEHFPVVERPDPPEGEPFRLVCVNRIEPKKGLIHLVEAVRLLNQRGLRVEMHQVGESDVGIQSSIDYRRKLVEHIDRHQLWGTVHLEGRQNADGVRRFLGQAHLFLAPFVETESGDKDGIPTALLEAMATGIAPVVTDAGSMREVVEDGVDGRMVAQRDPEALAAAIEELLRDPDRRTALGRAAAQTVRERFDVRVCEQWFHQRLEKILGERAP